MQPVLIRRPNTLDTLTWTWNQSYGAWGCFWLTLCQWSSNFEIEYLPVYHPSEDERTNPKLYASNVRLRMATRLGVPMVDRSVSEVIGNDGSAWSVNQLDNDALSGVKISKHVKFSPPPYVIDFVGNLTRA